MFELVTYLLSTLNVDTRAYFTSATTIITVFKYFCITKSLGFILLFTIGRLTGIWYYSSCFINSSTISSYFKIISFVIKLWLKFQSIIIFFINSLLVQPRAHATKLQVEAITFSFPKVFRFRGTNFLLLPPPPPVGRVTSPPPLARNIFCTWACWINMRGERRGEGGGGGNGGVWRGCYGQTMKNVGAYGQREGGAEIRRPQIFST